MDRQEEYELRQKISDAIAKDVSNVMADALRACNSNFSLEIMYPLELLERMYKRKNKGRFLCESDCKDKNFIYYNPKLFGSFFVLFFKRNFAFSLCQFCKAFFSWKAGAKVHPFSIQSKYIKLFFRSFFERIC